MQNDTTHHPDARWIADLVPTAHPATAIITRVVPLPLARLVAEYRCSSSRHVPAARCDLHDARNDFRIS
jgi:hypothetical protein